MFDRLLHTCLSPKTVYTSDGEKIIVPCGKCPYCVNKRGAFLSRLCESESSDSVYTYFCTLTYSNDTIPRALVSASDDGFDLYSLCPRDSNYSSAIDFDVPCSSDSLSRISRKCSLGDNQISYPLKSDVQKFLKRLRITLKRTFNCNEKIRYYLVSEYGPKTFRVHYHLLFFFNSVSISKVIGKAIRSAWKFGRVDYSKSRGSACNYVASYINSSVSLPSLYTAKSLRAFSSHSQYFAKGYYRYYKTQIYENPSFLVDSHTRILGSKSVEIFPDRSLKLLFYPKITGFSRLHLTDAVGLYRLYYTAQKALGFQSVSSLAKRLHYVLLHHELPMFEWLYHFLALKPITAYFPSQLQRLESLLYTSKHFIEFCCDGSVEYDVNLSFVRKIYDFYSRVSLSRLRFFYQAQVDLGDACTIDDIFDSRFFYSNLLPFYVDNWHKIVNKGAFDFIDSVVDYGYSAVLSLSSVARSFSVSDYQTHIRKTLRKLHNDSNNIFLN